MENQNPIDSNLAPVDLPKANAVLWLGISSLVCVCCCNFVGIILGAIGFFLSFEPMNLYKENPSAYTRSSYSKINTGRILGLVGSILSVVAFIYGIINYKQNAAMMQQILDGLN